MRYDSLNIDSIAKDGILFFDHYGKPSWPQGG